MLKWEYRTIIISGSAKTLLRAKGLNMDDQLNELGQEGWELVNMLGLGTGGSTQLGVQAVFKRPIE
ncbi:DUF4177 domain-containing protein [Heyndrickxia acidicola]|uniref:DUF4177 domain-containing protein n=1 Tax=Heyndrickxia acidicola TaxID=209389 RepID=A0ABU6MDT3_9BACI|nr:DUF4177 domain-containing protein [Heyndrickxia acidicola]MED1202567.1 DUF4177 domain-containing protein [Heyndrickxia acidicola]